MGAFFSTRNLKPSERFDYWHDVVYRTYAPCLGSAARIDQFDASVGVSEFGPAQITTVDSEGISYERRSFDVRTGPRDDFYVVAMLSGKTLVSQNGNEAIADAGDIYLYNSGQPYRHHSDQTYRCLSMRLPRPVVQSRILDLDSISGRVLAGKTPYGRMIGSLIREATEISANDEIADMSEFSGPIIEMISAAINRGIGHVGAAGTKHQAQLIRIQKYMRENLADGELTLARIAKDQNVSLRTLARMFAEMDTTPMNWLQSQRLASAYSAIAERRVSSITEAAFTSGFNDLSHFGRAFKKAYGHTPNKLIDPTR